MREFKDSITGNSKDDESESRPELTSATSSPSETAPGNPAAQRETTEVGSQPRA
jgi:hypothetical protein